MKRILAVILAAVMVVGSIGAEEVLWDIDAEFGNDIVEYDADTFESEPDVSIVEFDTNNADVAISEEFISEQLDNETDEGLFFEAEPIQEDVILSPRDEVLFTDFLEIPNDAFVEAVIGDDYPEKNACTGCHTTANSDHNDYNDRLFFYRQCTDFAAWCLRSRNGVSDFSNVYGGVRWGNANNWANAARSIGITVDNAPAVGAIACWTSGQWGHVAWVAEVNGGSVTIEEYNGQVAYCYSCRSISASNPSCYIHVKDLDNAPSLPKKNVLSGVYVIHSAWDDNMCLDISGDSRENNANIQLYQRVTSNNVQNFRIIRWTGDWFCIKSMHNDRWLDVKTPIGNNSNVKLYDTNDADEDFWTFEDAGDGYVYIKNKTGYYLDVQGDRAVNNANIQIYQYAGNNSQKWRLEEVTNYAWIEDGIYNIESAINSNYRFDISGNSREIRANLQLYSKEDTDVQQYKFVRNGNNYTIQSVYNGMWVDIKTPIGNNSNAQLWDDTNSPEEHWVLEDAGNGYVYMRSNADFYLDVQGDQAKNNANIQVYHFVGNNSQKWRLVKVVEPTVSPTPTNTPKPATPTPTPTNTPKPTPTNTPRPATPTPTNTPKPTPTITPKPTPTNTPKPATPTPTNTPKPATPTPKPQNGTISLNLSSVTLYVSSSQDSVKLVPTVSGFEDYDADDVEFISSKPSVCEVDDYGYVVAVKKGSATITAVLDVDGKEYKATCKVKVKKTTISVSPTSVTVKKGKKVTLRVSTVPADPVTFKSSNKKIATVSKAGVVKGKKKGSTTITVKCNGVSKKVKVTVTK